MATTNDVATSTTSTVTVTATIMIPQDASVDAEFCRRQQQLLAANTTNTNGSVVVLQCRDTNPSVVWKGLSPLLLESRKDSSEKTAQRALYCILQMLHFAPIMARPSLLDGTATCTNVTCTCTGTCTCTASTSNSKMEEEEGEGEHDKNNNEQDERVKMRRIRIQLQLSSSSGMQQQIQTSQHSTSTTRNIPLTLWIQPPSNTYYSTQFTKRLIAYEHQMILYQSIAAMLSTLGGGHFFCRHLGTAVLLAQQQRRVALAMGDYNMAYKCTINEAYSYIYAGKFALALTTIDTIPVLNKRVDIHPLSEVIVNMCASAKLFCKKVRKVSKTLKKSETKQQARTFDDYQRVRVVE